MTPASRDNAARAMCKWWRIPDALVGLPTPLWRRLIQRHITRRPQDKAGWCVPNHLLELLHPQ